ncbi:hypothetical protein [Gordonia sp. SND2]|uniref:hypothetical protein n=1 Tax=Gordonia sp. SND2 TaxID=3388659 RepID=UPI00398B0581
MQTFTTPTPPERGDVAHRYRVAGDVGDLHGIAIRLVGHAFTYVVAIVTGRGGPRLVDLQIRSDNNTAITPDVLRAIPSRRLAYAAARYVSEADGQIFTGPFLGPEADDMTDDQRAAAIAERRSEADTRPEASTSRGRRGPEHFQRVADAVRAANRSGKSARRAVAAEFGVSLPSVDKWIRQCKDTGLLAEDELR